MKWLVNCIRISVPVGIVLGLVAWPIDFLVSFRGLSRAYWVVWELLSMAVAPILIVHVGTKHYRGLKKVATSEAIGLFYTASLCGVFFTAWMCNDGSIIWYYVANLAILGVLLGPCALVFNVLFVNPFVRGKIEYKPLCESCGYSLHGLRDPRCPECGTPFDPSLLVHNSQRVKEACDVE